VSQFLFSGAIGVARRYNCVANCDAIALTGNQQLQQQETF